MTRLVAIGDSIYAGWDGKNDIPKSSCIPALIGQELGWDVDNTAISGAALGVNNDKGFVPMTNKINFANFDACLINLGVNDFGFVNITLDEEKNHLAQGVAKMRQDNPNIVIMFELPTQDFRNGITTLDQNGPSGWTQNQLDDALIDECKQLGVAYYDWRPNPIITYANANTTLGDGNTGVHPTAQTSALIAKRLAPWCASQMGGLIGYYQGNLMGIYNRIKQLYQIVQATFMPDDDEVPSLTVEPISATEINRAVYLWTIRIMRHLQDVVDWLVGTYNDYEIVDFTTGEKTNSLRLWIPYPLLLDNNYKANLNNDFQAVNKLLDRLFDYAKPYVKE